MGVENQEHKNLHKKIFLSIQEKVPFGRRKKPDSLIFYIYDQSYDWGIEYEIYLFRVFYIYKKKWSWSIENTILQKG